MEAVINSLAQQSGALIGFLLLTVIALVVWVFVVQSRLSRLTRRWNELLTGASGQNLEDLLQQHFEERSATKLRLREISQHLDDVERRVQSSKRFLGLVRYDAFQDVGGEQSFAMAIYDEDGNGAVITSLVGRSDCRVYAKPLVQGRSERTLSQEEQRAIREAEVVGPKPMVAKG